MRLLSFLVFLKMSCWVNSVFCGVIGLEESMTAMEFQRKLMEEKIYNKGIREGMREGRLAMAREFVDAVGIDEMVKLSGFSKEELLE